MNVSKFLAPRMSNKTILFLVFADLAITAILLTATSFESATALDLELGSQTISASAQTIVVEIREAWLPAAPYLIVEPAN